MARTRTQVADLSARMCSVWAEASQRRLRRLGELDRVEEPDQLTTANERLGEAFLAVIALEEALFWARWLIANRDGATDAFSRHSLDGKPMTQAEIDVMWFAIKARRDAIAHLEGEARADPSGALAITGDTIAISGYPRLSLVTCRIWSLLLAEWSAEILAQQAEDDGRPERRPGWVDDADWPRWLRSWSARCRRSGGSDAE